MEVVRHSMHRRRRLAIRQRAASNVPHYQRAIAYLSEKLTFASASLSNGPSRQFPCEYARIALGAT